MSFTEHSIVVTGADGTGKTTLLNSLKKKLEKKGYYVQIVSIWDLLENHKNFFSSKEEVQFYLKNLSSPSRFLFLMHCFFEAFNLKKKAQKGHKDFLLVDAYWYKYFTLECVYGADKEWMLKVISLFPKMTTYYIEESLEEQLKRKEESLTLYESGGEAKNKNFFLFQEKAKIFWKQLEEEFYFKKITEKTVEERTNAILKDLETYVYFCQ